MTSDLTQCAPAALRSLDPGVLQVIRSSADWLIHKQDAFIQHLYSDIVTMIPDLAAGGWTFCERMVHAVLWIATTDQAPQEIITALRWVGATNRLEGFPEAQYVSLAHALVRTVHVLSEDYWSTSTGSAWIGFFIWMKPHLLAGAQQAAAQEAAWQEAYPAQPAVSGSSGEYPPVTADDIDLESVASLLDDEDDDDESPGYGQIMASMTLKQRRERPD